MVRVTGNWAYNCEIIVKLLFLSMILFIFRDVIWGRGGPRVSPLDFDDFILNQAANTLNTRNTKESSFPPYRLVVGGGVCPTAKAEMTFLSYS